jgi:hypothetical protein
MPRSVIGERCDYCGRMLYASDFQRGLADTIGLMTYDGPDEKMCHTYDCEKEPRRLLPHPHPRGAR